MKTVARYSKLVLLVDDDPSDRSLFTRELQKLGFQVFATGNAEQAMARIVSGDIGCLVTDQVMRVSGHELVEAVRSVRSDIGVVFLSGAEQPTLPLPSEVPFINKGDVSALAEAVQHCMSRWQA
ncbi:MAG: hypothetical protein NVS9B15_16420 [Acidobacteriaceae bacterium]